MLNISSIEVSYQCDLKEEDKLKMKIQDNSRGKEKKDRSEKDKLSVEDEPKPIDQSKRRTCRAEFKGTFYKCGEVGHRFYECSKASDRIISICE